MMMAAYLSCILLRAWGSLRIEEGEWITRWREDGGHDGDLIYYCENLFRSFLILLGVLGIPVGAESS